MNVEEGACDDLIINAPYWHVHAISCAMQMRCRFAFAFAFVDGTFSFLFVCCCGSLEVLGFDVNKVSVSITARYQFHIPSMSVCVF